ncbi:MAG: tRNA-dihydrouridine synthase family protein [Desulfobacteraceae bacterium]|nr:tRNA-dihydrouridine synthase family protein [Desulfobacteraceae bacterium]
MDPNMAETILYLAPMRGFTDHIFRKTYAEHFTGLDCAVAPFIATGKNTTYKKKHIKDLWPENNPSLPVIPQILSSNAKDFTEFANFLFDSGYGAINWNLGCPFPMVARKGRGAGMLPHTETIQAFLNEVLPKIKPGLSLKLRLGWETREDILRLLPILNSFPLEELIIHARTGVQRYQGDVDLEGFQACVSASRHSLVYNGDIRTLEDFRSLSERFPGVHKWMIGRGCLTHPFLPQCIKQNRPDIENELERRKNFLEALFHGYNDVLDGPGHVLNKMKGFWQYFAPAFSGHEKTIKRIKKIRNPDEYLKLLAELFEFSEP